MINDAESHANEDEERRTHAEARNRADNVAYQTDKALADHGDKLTDDERTAVEDAVTELRKKLADDASTEDLNTAADAVLQASQILGQKVYEAEQAASESESSEEEGVVEAEIVEDAEVIEEDGDGS